MAKSRPIFIYQLQFLCCISKLVQAMFLNFKYVLKLLPLGWSNTWLLDNWNIKEWLGSSMATFQLLFKTLTWTSGFCREYSSSKILVSTVLFPHITSIKTSLCPWASRIHLRRTILSRIKVLIRENSLSKILLAYQFCSKEFINFLISVNICSPNMLIF